MGIPGLALGCTPVGGYILGREKEGYEKKTGERGIILREIPRFSLPLACVCLWIKGISFLIARLYPDLLLILFFYIHIFPFLYTRSDTSSSGPVHCGESRRGSADYISRGLAVNEFKKVIDRNDPFRSWIPTASASRRAGSDLAVSTEDESAPASRCAARAG